MSAYAPAHTNTHNMFVFVSAVGWKREDLVTFGFYYLKKTNVKKKNE